MATNPPPFPLQGTLLIQEPISYLACPSSQAGNPVIIRLLRSDPPNSPPDHDATQRATAYLMFQLGKRSHDPLTVTQGFWVGSGSISALCIITAL